jgi:hypothetical protein
MAGLVPAIHVLQRYFKDVDARHKAGHDGDCRISDLLRRLDALAGYTQSIQRLLDRRLLRR